MDSDCIYHLEELQPLRVIFRSRTKQTVRQTAGINDYRHRSSENILWKN